MRDHIVQLAILIIYLSTEISTSPNSRSLLLQASTSERTEGDALNMMGGDIMTWFVPPVIVPAFLVLLIIARVAYLSYAY
jgi:hypothetical protein